MLDKVAFAVKHIVIFIAVCMQSIATAKELCAPFHYPDGDTFYFKRESGEVRVRVAGFDAPERGQPFSQVAKRRMMELTGKGAECDCYKQDRYGRSVCTVHTLAGENVAIPMLLAGLGCIDERFERELSESDRRATRDALAQAQQAKRGIWSLSNPVCAFDYRRSKNDQR